MPSFFQGDLVRYVGQKFSQDLRSTKNGKVIHGEVVRELDTQPGAVVVSFGDDAYILRAESLIPFVPSTRDEEKETEVLRRRRSDSED